jgi:hypothetical protein
MTEIPIACTLSASQLRDRAAFIEALVADALLGQDEIEGGVRSRFRYAPDVERRVRELIAAEASCCAFLSFGLAREDGELWLDVTGAPEARPVIERFFVACGAPRRRRPQVSGRAS